MLPPCAGHAQSLRVRLQAAESQLEQLAEAKGAVSLVSSARYPATSQRYTNLFSAFSAADEGSAAAAAGAAGSGRSSPVEGASPAAAGSAADALSEVGGALAAAGDSLQRLASHVVSEPYLRVQNY